MVPAPGFNRLNTTQGGHSFEMKHSGQGHRHNNGTCNNIYGRYGETQYYDIIHLLHLNTSTIYTIASAVIMILIMEDITVHGI